MNRRMFCAILAGGCAVVPAQEKPSPEGMRLHLIDFLSKAQPYMFPTEDYNLNILLIKNTMYIMGFRRDAILSYPIHVIFPKKVTDVETAYQLVQQGKYKFSK